jgi:hypothetical protein
MNVQILLQAREKLRRDLDAGIAQMERGEGLDEDEVFEVLDRRIGGIERAKADMWCAGTGTCGHYDSIKASP